MSLDFQQASIVFQGGIETKTDPKMVVPAKLSVLENAVFQHPGALTKRDGFRALTNTILPSDGTDKSRLTTGYALSTFLNDLVAFDDTSAYAYSPNARGWAYKGDLRSAYVTQSNIVRNSYEQKAQDMAQHSNGLACFVYEDTSGGVRYTIMDGETVVVPSTLISATAVKPKVLVLNNLFVIMYVETLSVTKLWMGSIPVAACTTEFDPVAITGASGNSAINATTPDYDACVGVSDAGPQLYVVFTNALTDPGKGYTIYYFAPTNLTTPIDTVSTGLNPALLSIIPGSQNTIIIADYNGTTLGFRQLSSTLLGEGVRHTIGTVSDVISLSGISVAASLSATPAWKLYFSTKPSAAPWAAVTGVSDLTKTTATAPALLLTSVALAGKVFFTGGLVYIPLVHDSDLQRTYFLADETGTLVSKMLYTYAGGIPTRDSLGSPLVPETVRVDDTTWRFPQLVVEAITTTTGRVTTQTGLSAATVSFFDATRSYSRVELAQNLHIGGGFLQMLDGYDVVEHGFHLYPENLDATAGEASTGQLTGGKVYAYCCTFQWSDAQGNIYESAPSVSVSVTAAASGSTTVTVPTLGLTAKTGSRSPVLVVFYRTIGDGTTFYRCCTQVPHATPATNQPILNNPAIGFVTFIDTQIADNSQNGEFGPLIGNPVLYTSSIPPVLENTEPNAVSSLTTYRNRVVALDSTQPLVLWYSKQVTPGIPANFSESFTLNIDPQGGPVTAVSNIDDKLIVFKESSIFFVTGIGPDNTGGQNDFSDATRITVDCGCVNGRSIAITPEGLMFKSSKGIYQLDRNLSVSYIGAPVEAYNSETVTSATLVSNTNQVRFTLANKTCLVWDYFQRQWSVFTNYNAVDSVIWEDNFTHLLPSGGARTETPGIYSDDGAYINMFVQTAWLQFAGIQNFQRIRDMLILGQYDSPHNLQVGCLYDFNPAATQTSLVEPTEATTYGADSPYGSGSPYGGLFPLYQYRVFFERQKCQAIQLSFKDIQTGTDVGQGFSLSAINLTVGVKKGHAKVPATSAV